MQQQQQQNYYQKEEAITLADDIVNEIYTKAHRHLANVSSPSYFHTIMAALAVFPHEIEYAVAASHILRSCYFYDKFPWDDEAFRDDVEKKKDAAAADNKNNAMQQQNFKPVTTTSSSSKLNLVVVCGRNQDEDCILDEAENIKRAMYFISHSNNHQMKHNVFAVKGSTEERADTYARATSSSPTSIISTESNSTNSNNDDETTITTTTIVINSKFLVADILHRRISLLLISGAVVFLHCHRVYTTERFALSLLQPQDMIEQEILIKSQRRVRFALCLTDRMSVTNINTISALNALQVQLFPRMRVSVDAWVSARTQHTSSIVEDFVASDPKGAELMRILRSLFGELVIELNRYVVQTSEQYDSVKSLLEYLSARTDWTSQEEQHLKEQQKQYQQQSSSSNNNYTRNYNNNNNMNKTPTIIIPTENLLSPQGFYLLRDVIRKLPVTSHFRDICESLLHVRRMTRLASRVDAGTFVTVLEKIASDSIYQRSAQLQQMNRNRNQMMNNTVTNNTHLLGGANAMVAAAASTAFNENFRLDPLMWMNSPSTPALIQAARSRAYMLVPMTQEEQEVVRQQHLQAVAQQQERAKYILEQMSKLHEEQYSAALNCNNNNDNDDEVVEILEQQQVKQVKITEEKVNDDDVINVDNDNDNATNVDSNNHNPHIIDNTADVSSSDTTTNNNNTTNDNNTLPTNSKKVQRNRVTLTIQVPTVYHRLRELISRMLKRRAAAPFPETASTTTSSDNQNINANTAATTATTATNVNVIDVDSATENSSTNSTTNSSNNNNNNNNKNSNNNNNNNNNQKNSKAIILIVVPSKADGGATVLDDVRAAISQNKLSDVRNVMIHRFAARLLNVDQFDLPEVDDPVQLAEEQQQQQEQEEKDQEDSAHNNNNNKKEEENEKEKKKRNVKSTTKKNVSNTQKGEEMNVGGETKNLEQNSINNNKKNNNQTDAATEVTSSSPSSRAHSMALPELFPEELRAFCTSCVSQSQTQNFQQSNNFTRISPSSNSNSIRRSQRNFQNCGFFDEDKINNNNNNNNTSNSNVIIDVDAAAPPPSLLPPPSSTTHTQSSSSSSLSPSSSRNSSGMYYYRNPFVGYQQQNSISPSENQNQNQNNFQQQGRSSSTSSSSSSASTTTTFSIFGNQNNNNNRFTTPSGDVVEISSNNSSPTTTEDPEELQLHSAERIYRDGYGEFVRINNNNANNHNNSSGFLAGLGFDECFRYRMHNTLDIVGITLNVVSPSLFRQVFDPTIYRQRQMICLDVNLLLLRTLELFQAEEGAKKKKKKMMNMMNMNMNMMGTNTNTNTNTATTTTIPKLNVRIIAEHGGGCHQDVLHEIHEERNNVKRLSFVSRTFTPRLIYRSPSQNIPLFTVPTTTTTTQQKNNNTSISNIGSNSNSQSSSSRTVLVDDRELRADLPFYLHEVGLLRIVPLTLVKGDYILSRDLAIERKAIEDLVGSIRSGRLNNQLVGLQAAFKFPTILVELSNGHGALPAVTTQFGSNGSYNGVKENFAKLVINTDNSTSGGSSKNNNNNNKNQNQNNQNNSNNIISNRQFTILWTSGPAHSARLLSKLKTTMAADDLDPSDPALSVASSSGSADQTRAEAVQEVVRRLPNCAFVSINKIIHKSNNIADSLAGFVSSSSEQLQQVLGNKEKSDELYNFLHTPLTSPLAGQVFL